MDICSVVLRTQKLRSPSVENPELINVLPFKVGQNITRHASPPARNVIFALVSTFSVQLPPFVFSKSSLNFCTPSGLANAIFLCGHTE